LVEDAASNGLFEGAGDVSSITKSLNASPIDNKDDLGGSSTGAGAGFSTIGSGGLVAKKVIGCIGCICCMDDCPNDCCPY
jgi:hypothetical protein